MDGTSPWNQVNVSFPSWDQAEDVTAARIAPQLETGELVTAWWFIRKAPCWRIRYQPAGHGTQTRVERRLDILVAAGRIAGWTPPRPRSHHGCADCGLQAAAGVLATSLAGL